MTNLAKAVCILITNPDTGQILVVSRKDDPDSFGLPGGKVDTNETPEDAICRETREETGLAVKPEDLTLVFEEVCLRHAPEGTDYYAYGFVASCYDGEIFTQEKGVVRWGSWEDLAQGAFAVYNKGFHQAVLEWQNN